MPNIDLSLFTLEDIDETYLSWFSDPEVVQHLDVRHVVHDKNLLTASAEIKVNDTNSYFYSICAKSGEKIGTVSLQKEPHDDVGSYGYLIGSREYWGGPFALQAQIAILDFGFSHLNLRRIWGGATAGNLASLFNFRRLGFKHEGTRRQAMTDASGNVVDSMQFGILAPEWSQQRNRLFK